MKRKTLLMLVATLLLCFTGSMNAQNSNLVQGTIIDGTGDPLPGVSVLIKGSSNGTITDIDGNFQIDAKPSDVLRCSFVGYQQQDVPVGNKKVFKITMEEESQNLSEVVVVAVGYGDVRRRDLTGSIGKANIGDITRVPTSNVASSLGGRIAGVRVTSNDGGLGDNFNIVVRGAGSLTQSTAPLYVIDGFPQETSNLSSLNPNDIESIDVLKDASATAIYGSRGANGVVIITTKSGKEGKASVTYNGSVTVGKVRNKMELMNGYDFAVLQQEIMGTDEFASVYLKDGKTLEDYKTMPSYDWQDEIFRTSVSQNHHVSLNGASDKGLRYSSSISYNNQQGVIINSDLTRYQARINLSQRVNKRLKIDANANFASNVQNGPNPSNNTSSASTAWMYSVWAYRPVSPSGSNLLDEIYDTDIDMSEDYRFNPVLSARNEHRRNVVNTLQANLGIEYTIIKNLKLKVTAGYNGRDTKNEEFNGSKTRTGNTNPANTQSKGINAKLTQGEYRSYLNENTLSYQFTKSKHSMNLLGGLTFQKNTSYVHSAYNENIPNESLGMAGIGKGSTPLITASKGENTMMSYFGRINYNYDSRYYFNMTMRADGSSKFPKPNRWGYFPSASVAWAFSREKAIEQALPWLSNGKVRASWGLTGNNRVGNYDFMAKLITSDTSYKYPWDSTFDRGFVLSALANHGLKWETTEQLDFGLDLGFFNDRVNVSLDYYIKTTKDLLLNADVPGSSGFSTAMLNVGKLRNKGLEITIETTNIQNKNFTWTSNFNIAFNNNKIVSLTEGKGQMYSSINWDTGYRGAYAYISKIGESAGMMYGYVYDGTYKEADFDITYNDNGKKIYTLKDGVAYISKDVAPGDPKFKNIDGSEDFKITDSDKTAIGNGQPKHTGGFTNNFTYKNWDLNVFLQWSYGNDILNANRMFFENGNQKNRNMFASYTNRWTEDNPTSDMPRAKANNSKEYSSLYVEDGSFLKLKNISLGYNFASKTLAKANITQLRLYVSAENIYTWTKYSGSDPEVSTRNSVLTPGFDWSAYPRAFNASFGASITF